MSNKIKTTFHWNENTGVARCTIVSPEGQSYTGIAYCHDEDADMKSEKVGCHIAELRARISYLRFMRDGNAIPALKALNQCYYSMNKSKHFDPKNYQSITLFRQIRFAEENLATIKQMLIKTREELHSYMNDKDKLHQSLRRYRKANTEQ